MAEIASERLRALSLFTFNFTLPPGWEITSYLAASDDGQLHFHLRERLVARLDWRALRSPPDETRLMHALAERARPASAEPTTLSFAKEGAWVLGYEEVLRYASLYQSDSRILIQWVFAPAGDGARTNVAVQQLLASYSPNTGPLRAWRLFGIKVRLPSSFSEVKLRPDAGDVSLRWDGPQRTTVVARSIGMAESVLAQTSIDALAREALHREHASVQRSEPRAFRGCPGVHTTFVRRAEHGLEALLGRPMPGESQVWHDRDEHRIYALTQWGTQPNDALALEDIWGEPTPGRELSRGHRGAGADMRGADVSGDLPPRSTFPAPTTSPQAATSSASRSSPATAFDRLQSIALRNERATVHLLSDARARVNVQQSWPRGLQWLARVSRVRSQRSFELDALGSALFQRLEPNRSVVEHVDWLAREHHLSFHEARVLVMKYLEALLARGLIAIAVPSSAVHRPPTNLAS